jgi:hypothetical protein
MQEERDKKWSTVSSAYSRDMFANSRTKDLNFCLKNRMMDLRKVTNHPYLVEYPLSEDGVFYRIDEELVRVRLYHQTSVIWDRCYDFLNIFAKKFSEKIGGFVSKQSQILKKVDHNI